MELRVGARACGTAATIVAFLAGGQLCLAATVVPPRSLGELARSSEAVVLAEAIGSSVRARGELLFTVTELVVERVVAGEVAVAETVMVETPGGESEDGAWVVEGSPRFTAGETYLLFLSHRGGATVWQPRMLAYGLLRQTPGPDGTPLLQPLEESHRLTELPRPDGAVPEAQGTYRAEALLRHLGAVSRGDELRRDFNFTRDATFVVDMPAGTYTVTATLGDALYGHDEMGIFLEGSRVDSVATVASQFATVSHDVEVSDGQLTVSFRDLGGVDEFVTVNSLEWVRQTARGLDFGTSASPVAEGFASVLPGTVYDAGLGFGWLAR